jgi:hypothetical protein
VATVVAGVVTGCLTLSGALPAGAPVLLGASAGVLGAVLANGQRS